MRVANSRRELNAAEWEDTYEEFTRWFLPDYSGTHSVYVQFQSSKGEVSGVYSDSIRLNLTGARAHLTINGGDVATISSRVKLNIGIPPDTTHMRISNYEDMSDGKVMGVANEVMWTLRSGTGRRTVYLQFQFSNGGITRPFADSINVIQPITTPVDMSINRDVARTFTQDVILSLSYNHGIKEIRISNTPSFSGVPARAPDHLIPWKLPPTPGIKTVWVQFTDLNNETRVVQDSITLVERASSSETSASQQTLRSQYARRIVKGPGPGIFYVGDDGKLHPFQNSKVFYSWNTNVRELTFLSGAQIAQFEVGDPVCMRAGTYLIKFGHLPEIYSPELGCHLKPIRSEVEAFLLYGPNWAERIVELPATGQAGYFIRSTSAADSTQNIIDADGDGVDKKQEEALGSSDRKADTDGDKLSDYEEIFWWFTSPTVRDTDGDGVNDGDEIMQRRSPLGQERLSSIVADTYSYPVGSVFRHGNNRYYFQSGEDGPLYMGWRTSDRRFTSHRFQPRFVIQSPISFGINTNVRSLTRGADALIYPNKYTYGKVTVQ